MLNKNAGETLVMEQNDKIQLFENKRIRTAWDEEKEEWFFSVVDVVAVLTDQPDQRHAAKYWSVLKTRLKKEGSELTTNCSQLKLTAADGKKYATDCFAQEDITALVKLIPSKKATTFLDWFTYSDNTIDGKSKKKAYTSWKATS